MVLHQRAREQQTRKQRNCRYWPEVHQLRQNGTLPIRPGKVENILQQRSDKYRVYQQTINLCEHALVGPFNFAEPRDYQQEANRIAFEEWEELKTTAPEHDVDISDIEEIIPLH